MTEEWRDIAGYEGLYQVSCRGRVKSLARMRLGRGGSHYSTPERILKPGLCGAYLRVHLFRENVAKSKSVQSLVCAAFIGPKPQVWQCRHWNGDPTDNRVKNLVYGTVKENHADKKRHGTDVRGEAHGRSKLKDADVLEIRRLLADGNLTQLEIGEMFGAHQGTISKIKLSKHWSHLGETT